MTNFNQSERFISMQQSKYASLDFVKDIVVDSKQRDCSITKSNCIITSALQTDVSSVFTERNYFATNL